MNVNDPNTQAVLSAVRSILIAIGGFIVQHGYMTDAAWQQVVGALMVLIPAGWAMVAHYRSEAATKAREAQAVNVGIAVADRTPGITPPVPAANVPAVIAAFKPVLTPPTSPEPANPTGLSITPSSPVIPTP